MIRFGSNDTRARTLAAELAEGFAHRGLQVDTTAAEGAEIAESEVRYFYDDDASLAREVATALPVLADRTVFRPVPGREPGTVEIRLHGGPAP